MIGFRFLWFLVLLAALTGAACAESPTGPTAFAPFSQTDLRTGTGATAATGSVIRVHYTGWLFDPAAPEEKGIQFDSSRGLDPFTFVLGAGQVIAGWDQGVPGMMEGGLRRLVIPPSLAYGDTRRGTIPQSSTLLFEIELLEIVPPADAGAGEGA